MNKKTEMINKLTEIQKKNLLEHFDTIYECTELSEHEYKIVYLAWLWANGKVYKGVNFESTFDEKEAGVPLNDYEITFEDETGGGVNLDIMYGYYEIEKIMQILKTK